MNFICKTICQIVILFGLCSPTALAETLDGIKNLRTPSATHFAAGQPTAEQFGLLKNVGIEHVINFRPKEELGDLDEEMLVVENGLSYHHLPIASAQDFTPENVAAFNIILENIGDEKVLLHCASSNRVGAMMALRANWLQGTPADEAIAMGKSYGLTRLEAVITPMLK